MQELVQKIENFLHQERHGAIHIYDGENSLKKDKAPKQYFFLEDIQQHYGSVENLLRDLPKKGLTNGVQIQFLKSYKGGAKSKVGEPITINFSKQEQQHNIPQLTHQPMNTTPVTALSAPQMGLGYTSVSTADWISLKVKEERLDDLQNENYKLKEELSETKSELRKEKEEKRSLQLRLDTLDEKHNLELKKAELDRKSFFESAGFEKVSETLGAVIPHFLQAQSAKNVSALGSAELSEVKKQFIQLIHQNYFTDQDLELCVNFITKRKEKQQQKSIPNE